MDPGLGVLYLDGIRAPWNVGALFRAAEAFGINRVVLGPGSAAPTHPRALRAAAGTVERVPWEIRDLPDLMTELDPALDWAARVFALETGGTALDHTVLPLPGIMVVGHEELGVSPAALRCAEAGIGRVSIPFPGTKGSLNVSVAAGIALHAWNRQLQLRMTS
jgi:TrmH family RNA methyltransferase